MYKDYVAVIQAGGQGVRMRDLTKNLIPKPMLLLNGKPMIQWQIENISQYGICEFVFIIGHLGEKVKEYFEDGSKFGVHIHYVEEVSPLGSAGALFYLKNIIQSENFLLVYGDVMFCVDWDRMINFHEKMRGKATLLVHPNTHPIDSDLLIMDDENHITGIDSKSNKRNYWYENCVNSGIYIFSSDILQKIKFPEKLDLEKDILKHLVSQNKVYGYKTSEYVKDAGTPERFYKICQEQKNGIWERKSLNNKQCCVFMDRDGTINKYRGFISHETEFQLEETATEAIKMLNEEGILAIVVTNQSVVARGLCDIEDVKRIHKKMQTLLGKEGAYLDEIVFCPHHPDKGYPEENPQYKIVCNCRKPATGMIEYMIERYNIDIQSSYMIGDSTVDVQTGIYAGLKTILLETGQGGTDRKFNVSPDVVKKDIKSAVEYILRER